MNATPVIIPATVNVVLQLEATDPLSKKKNTVAANRLIEITQNEIPTRSSAGNKSIFAFAVPDKISKVMVAKTNSLSLFIKNSLFLNSFDVIYINYTSNNVEVFLSLFYIDFACFLKLNTTHILNN